MSGVMKERKEPGLRRFKPYPKYKDSGIEWLGEIPAHWAVKKLSWLTDCLDGRRVPLNAEERALMQGEYPYWGANSIVDCVDKWLFDEELVLLGEDGAPFFDRTRSVAFCVTGKVWVNNHAHVLRAGRHIDASFLAHVLNCVDYRAFIDGSTRDKLTQSAMRAIGVQCPPIAEQRLITAFLNREAGRIDALVAKKERLIELLHEKRAALVTEAVTKGLNPNVRLKDAVVDWLTQIPAHWRPTKVKRLFRQTKRQGHKGLAVLSVYREYGVIEKASRDDNFNKTPEDLDVYQLVNVGDLVINKMKAWQGSLGVSPLSGITSPDYLVYAPRHSENNWFLHHFLRNRHLKDVYLTMSNGIRPSQWRLEPDRFADLVMFIPPGAEQAEICDYINGATRYIDQLSERVAGGLTKLQELRTALVSAAVTGKIDVREETA